MPDLTCRNGLRRRHENNQLRPGSGCTLFQSKRCVFCLQAELEDEVERFSTCLQETSEEIHDLQWAAASLEISHRLATARPEDQSALLFGENVGMGLFFITAVYCCSLLKIGLSLTYRMQRNWLLRLLEPHPAGALLLLECCQMMQESLKEALEEKVCLV